MVIVSLRSNRSICGVGWVVVLPIDVHEAWGSISYTMRCTYWESYLVANEDRSDLNEDDVNTPWSPNSTPISRRIGMASLIAATTWALNKDDKVTSLRAAVKLVDEVEMSDDMPGTGMPSVSSTARTVRTKFFWTGIQHQSSVKPINTMGTYIRHSPVSVQHP